MICFIFFIICLIEVITAVDVNDEDQFLSGLNKNTNIVSLSIDTEIRIINKIIIHNSIKKLSINGSSLNSAKLNLQYPLYFNSSIEEININNITINGTLSFQNNQNIIIDTVNLNGFIDSDFGEKSNIKSSITVKSLTYKSTGEPVYNCINLSGNVKIFNSKFYGDSSCRNRLLHFNGFKQYKFDITESYFSGNNKCPLLSVDKASNSNIKFSNFEKAYSSENIEGG